MNFKFLFVHFGADLIGIIWEVQANILLFNCVIEEILKPEFHKKLSYLSTLKPDITREKVPHYLDSSVIVNGKKNCC